MPMRREYAAKTSFAKPDGQYKWAGRGTPFGLSGAKVTFQRLKSALLGELNCTAALCYLDHVLVWGHRQLDGAQQPVAGGAQETQVGCVLLNPDKCCAGGGVPCARNSSRHNAHLQGRDLVVAPHT